MAPAFNGADNESWRPLGSQVERPSTEGDMNENQPSRDIGAENPNAPQGDDYEYDEAHDALAGPLGPTLRPHRVNPPPQAHLGQGRGLWLRRGP